MAVDLSNTLYLLISISMRENVIRKNKTLIHLFYKKIHIQCVYINKQLTILLSWKREREKEREGEKEIDR